MDDTQRAALTRVLTREEREATSLWQRLKREPKQPTTNHMREHLAQVRWLQTLNTARQALDGMPETKLQRFADEARALNVARMQALQAPKRFTLAVTLIRLRTAQALDDLAEMFIGVWRILCIAQIEHKRISAYARSATRKHTPERISSCSNSLYSIHPSC